MDRRTLFAAAFAAILAASPAFASAEKKEEKKEGKEGKEGKGDVGQYVDLQPTGLPIVSKGRLVNYVFVYVRINLANSANVSKLREKEPFFRDALVRAGHRTPFTLESDLSKIDGPRLVAALTREATSIAGPGQIRSVVVTSQEPRRRMVPRPA